MAGHKAIQLDWYVEDGNYKRSLDEFSIKHGITYEVVAWQGPAGGNPLIEFRGTEEQLRNAVWEYVEQDHSEFNYLVKFMEDENA